MTTTDTTPAQPADHVTPAGIESQAVLAWFSGARSVARARDALAEVAASERAGYWLPGVSRRARAALSRQGVAARFARANDRYHNIDSGVGLLTDVADIRGEGQHRARRRGWILVHAMMFGTFEQAPELGDLVLELEAFVQNDAERAALATARRWTHDFTPLARLFDALDAVRPRPNYTSQAVSPTVLANVGHHMRLRFDTVRVAEVEWRLVMPPCDDVHGSARAGYRCARPAGQVDDHATEGGLTTWPNHRTGTRRQVWVGRVLWPAGTRHGTSRYHSGSQCQACGHRIRSPDNWVPLVLDGDAGPASLWVGRDCARSLFGVRASGEGRVEMT